MLNSTSMRAEVAAYIMFSATIAALLLGAACAPEKPPAPASSAPAVVSSVPSSEGTITIDALISKGTRFTLYINDGWKTPQSQPLVPGQRTKYSFRLPSPLQSLRFDPSELAGSHAVIYSVVLDIPGMQKKVIPVKTLMTFLKYHCELKPDDTSLIVDATDRDEYFMGLINPSAFPVAE